MDFKTKCGNFCYVEFTQFKVVIRDKMDNEAVLLHKNEVKELVPLLQTWLDQLSILE
jgi:hypothetical protein